MVKVKKKKKHTQKKQQQQQQKTATKSQALPKDCKRKAATML